MRELGDLLRKSWPRSTWKGVGASNPFVLENGREQLLPFFPQVTLDLYENALEVTEAEPLAAYAFSGRHGSLLPPEVRESCVDFLRQELAAQGSIHLTASSDMFIAPHS